MTAVVEPAAGAFGFQPVMYPVIDAKMKRAGHDATAHGPGKTKSVDDGLAIVPVGRLPGMSTVCGLPFSTNGLPDTSPLRSCAVLVRLLATQKGLLAVIEMPHGLTSSGSWMGAKPGISETRFVWR